MKEEQAFRVTEDLNEAQWPEEDDDPAAGVELHEKVRLKAGFVCKRCKKSVLAFSRPKRCREHD